MEVTVDRYISDRDTTLSRIRVDGVFCAYGLEDEHRVIKVAGETRVPAGRYQVKVRHEGKHYQQYQRLFPEWHRGTLHITNVPGFKWIMIHIGNTDEDTEGCLLVGSSVGRDMTLKGSRDAYRRFYLKVIEAAELGELWITFTNNDNVRETEGV
jgi:hypothetical protein